MKEGQQDNRLIGIVRAVKRAERLLNHSGPEPGSSQEFKTWWDGRRQIAVDRLQDAASGSPGSLTGLRRELGVYLLDPEQGNLEAISSDLDAEIERLRQDVVRAQQRRNGHDYPKPAAEVLGFQISELEKLRDRARDLRTAIGYVRPTSTPAPGTDGTKLEQCKTTLRNDVESPLVPLIDKLYRLSLVVGGIKNQLPAAYRDNREQQWQAIEQWHTGWEFSGNSDSEWVPKDLKVHRTLTWITESAAELQERRNGLEKVLEELVWCLRWEELEASPPRENAAYHQPGSKRDRAWAETYISQSWRAAQEQGTAPIGVKSLLEAAQERMRTLEERAEPDEYREFVQGTAAHLKAVLRKRVGPTFSENELQRRLEAINQARTWLQPVLGGAQPGSPARPIQAYSPWAETCTKVVRLCRQAKFEEAQGACTSVLKTRETVPADEQFVKRMGAEPGAEIREWPATLVPENRRPSTLAEALDLLDWVPPVQPLSAMEKMLLAEAGERKAILEDEREKIQRLNKRVGELGSQFAQHESRFGAHLEQYRKLTRGLGAQFRQKRAHEAYAEAGRALEECWHLCPEQETTRGRAKNWRSALASPPDFGSWQQKYLDSDLGCDQDSRGKAT